MVLAIILFVGLIAGILMFSGDMLLYYDKKDYVSDGTFHSVIEIIKIVSDHEKITKGDTYHNMWRVE